MGAFIHLHCHSAFSLLDGLGSPSKWVAAAAEKGFPALAITDHGSVSGAVELFKAGKQHGIQTMVGCEFYCVDDVSFRLKKGEKRQEQIHLTVIAKTFSGLQSIFEHLSLANRQFYFKPILGLWDQIYDFKDCIVMTACAFGILSHEKHGELVTRLHQAYGDDFYLEIMPHDFEMQKRVNATAQVLAKHHGIKLVATNDAHYPNADDVDVHDAMLAIQTRSSLRDPNRFSFKEGGLTSLYMANLEEMCLAFSPWVDRFDFSQETVVSAFQATYEIAEKCRGFEIPKLNYALPSLYEDERDQLSRFCLEGLQDRVVGKVADPTPYIERLRYELSVIGKLGVERYLLMAHEFVSWARSEGILCGFGRGSAGGSLVCYLLWITGLDPIKFNLSFERFLNPDRIDLPDIDMDFAALDRDRVIEHIKEKYGSDHVAQISTVSKLHGKGAFRDICRVLDVPIMEVNRLTGYIDDETPLEEIVGLNTEMKAFTERYPKLPEYLVKLGGQIRSRSQHAGGVIVSSDGFDGRAVIESRKGDSALAVNWTMGECDHMGLLKFDILGLDNISVLKNAADMVKERTGKEIDYFEIEPNDPEVLEEFSDGNTGGFFQFEGDGMTSICTGIAPITAFEDLIQVAALYRPGPLDSGMVQSFIKRKKGEEPISYLHPKEAEITKPTRGLLIFQEQVAALFVELAGFTKAEADKMRKIISKKLGAEEFEKYREAWLKGCAENTPDLDPAIASGLFDSIVKFASYSFNRCVAGDTVLMRAGSNHHMNKPMTVREMFLIMNDRSYAKEHGHVDLHSKWKLAGNYGYGMSMESDCRVRKNIIADIQYAGAIEVFRLTLENGSYIDVTGNHKFPTSDGIRMLSDIQVGSSIFVCGDYEKTDPRRHNLSGPFHGQDCRGKTYEANPAYTNGSFIKYDQFKKNTANVCNHCGALDGRIEVHHIDGDRTNSDWSNLEKLCSTCHKKADYRLGRIKRGEKGYPTEEVKIRSIESLGVTHTFDVTMDEPFHNFVTDQRIVTCNSHSACYAYIAYLNAYMKHYHPTEFCAGLLQCKVGKTEKAKRYVQECKRLGIEVMPPDINFSEGNFRVTGDKRIHAGFRSVKGIAEKATVEILKARQTGGGFIDFKDFLLKTERRTINKRVIEALAYCGAFTSIEKNTKWIVTNYEALVKGRATVEIPDFSWKEIQTLRADMLPGIFDGSEIDVEAKLVIDKDILGGMINEIKECKACELSQSHYCTAPVPFCFRPKSKLMLVAEAPGKDEDKKGDEPLVGDAGRRMEELFREELNMTTKRQLKANVFNCRPVNNKLPENVLAECVCGKLWLDRLIKATEPEVIFAMGAVPLRFFTGQTKGITRISGEAIWHPDYKCMIVYSVHPASCLKFRDEGGERTAAFRKALQKLKAFL